MTKTCMNCNYRNSPLTEYPCKYCDECKLWKPKECCSEFAIAEFEKIKEILNNKMKEPQYQHEGEDWITGLIMAEDIVDDFISELKGE